MYLVGGDDSGGSTVEQTAKLRTLRMMWAIYSSPQLVLDAGKVVRLLLVERRFRQDGAEREATEMLAAPICSHEEG
jgi:hypothetical protein